MNCGIVKKAACALAAAIAAAGGVSAGEPAAPEPARLKVVATTFPIYDWTREVVGERLAACDLVLLQQSGADLHSYSPSAADLRKIAACDLFVFVGGESDGWTERALAQTGGGRRRVLSLVKALGPSAKEEKSVEGMEHHGHDHHDHAEGERGHDDGESEIDEHVWLSLRNAATLVRRIAAELSSLDPANAAAYKGNAAAYCARLAALDGEYAAAVAAAKRRTLLVADRFPFRYLADDYGLEYFAAFAGCSAESEASFKTVVFLAKKADELGTPVILTTEGTKHRIAEAVRRASKSGGQRIMELDSLQSTAGAAAKETRYIDVMARNLETLKAALR